MTPEAVEEKYGVPPERYPELAALVGETCDNLPGVPGVGPKTAAKWINQYGGLDGVIANADKITGKAGETLREHLGDVMRNRQLNALVCDLDCRRPEDLAAQRGTARRSTRCSTPWSSGCCATGCSRPGVRGGDRGSVRARRHAGAGRGRGVARRAASGRRRVGAPGAGHVGRGTGDVSGVALAAADGAAAWIDVEEISPRTTRRSPPGSPTRACPRCSTTPRARAGARAHGWTLAGVAADTALSRTSRGPTSAPTTSPT